MTGTVASIRGTQQSYCRIQGDDGIEYHAHQNSFIEKGQMVVGNYVSFKVAEAQSGPRPDAIDVAAIHKQAA